MTQVNLYEVLILNWTPIVSKICCEKHTCENLCFKFFVKFWVKGD